MGRIAAFNDRLTETIVDAVSTPWAFYLCNVLILGTLLMKRPEDLYAWTLFASTIWFQAVMLPVLASSNKVQIERQMGILIEELALLREEHQRMLLLCERLGVE